MFSNLKFPPVPISLTLCANLPLRLQIAFVANHDDGEVVLVLDSKNLLLESQDFFKALPAGYGVDEQEAFARSHVLLAHCAVFLLACSIEHVQQSNLLIDNALLAVRI
jgi:hypothetical protein